MPKPKVYVVLLAGGRGERTGISTAKQLIKVAGKTIIEHTLDAFERHAAIERIIIVSATDSREMVEQLVLRGRYRKVTRILNGGDSRRESSAIGVNAIDDHDAWVLMHDAVRPFVSEAIIDRCLDALSRHRAVDVAIPSADTIIRVDQQSQIDEIPKRAAMLRGQTPQAFHVGLIREAHRRAEAEGEPPVTDDCGLVLRYELAPVYVVAGEERNIKITFPLDLYLADRLFQLKTAHLAAADAELDRLRGKTLCVFGGTRGIGEKIVEHARERGANAYAWSRRTGVDVTDLSQVTAALSEAAAEHGAVDFVVNSSAVLGMGRLEDRAVDEIDREIDVNYRGAVNVVRAATPLLRATHGAMLLFTSSSYTRGRALYSVYSSTKAALVNLVQAVAEELAGDGVRINAINPERTATPMRTESFGREPPGTLLDPGVVADLSLKTLLSPLTGEVVDVRQDRQIDWAAR